MQGQYANRSAELVVGLYQQLALPKYDTTTPLSVQ
jgi:hypothetical protein